VNRIITMTAYRRPLYTRQVLEALAQCEGVADWRLIASVEPGCEEVAEAFEGFDACEKHVVLNYQRKGLNRNTHAAMLRAVDADVQTLVHLEDDVVPSPDALRYFAWAVEEAMPRLPDDVLFASGYRKSPREPKKKERFLVNTRSVFTPWGWAVDRQRLDWMLKRWRFKNPKCFTCAFKKRFQGSHRELFPLLSRIQNIGFEDGENNRTPQWYRENHFTPWVAGVLPAKPYRLVGGDSGSTPAKARRYVSEAQRWIQQGRPVRTDAEVAAIYELACVPCEHFDARRNTCTVCGCRIRKSGRALTNKLKMATTSCPKGKWGPGATPLIACSSGIS